MFVLKFRDQIYKINSILDDFTTVLNSSEDRCGLINKRAYKGSTSRTDRTHYKMKQPEELDD